MTSFRTNAGGVLVAIVLALTFTSSALAAGSVAMQIEHLVRQAVEEYNASMDSGDSANYLKYFASNATYESPVFRYAGRAELARHFEAEFKAFRARYQIRKMFVEGSSAAILLTWEGMDRQSNDAFKIDMVGVYEVGSSGQFSSATFYFDSAKAKAISDLVK